MPSFIYLGNHDQITQHEITFKKGVPVDVSGKVLKYPKTDPLTKKRFFVEVPVEVKLRGNPEYEEVFANDGVEVIPKRKGRPPRVSNESTNSIEGSAKA